MPSRTRHSWTVAVIALVVVGATWYLTSSPEGSDDDAGTWKLLQARASLEPPLAASRRLQRQRFSIMRGRPERMPDDLRAHVKAQIGAPAEARLVDTQRARTSAGDLWIANVGNATCLAQSATGAVACETAAGFAARGLSIGIFAAPRAASEQSRDFAVLGVARDGVDVAQTQVGESIRRVTVRGNAYGLRATAPIAVKRLERRGWGLDAISPRRR